MFEKAKVNHEFERAIFVVAHRISLLAKSFIYVLRTCVCRALKPWQMHISS